jgi:predicted phosphodiesterase
MKTIVIPDIHQRVSSVRYILNTETNYDEVVFLGDWFDSFYDPPKVSIKTIIIIIILINNNIIIMSFCYSYYFILVLLF